MMMRKFCFSYVIAVVALLSLMASVSSAVPPAAADPEKQVRELVNAAARLIGSKGEAAIAELNVKNGPWHKGETAIFVSSETGVELVNAAQPEMVGKNLWNFKGPDGKQVIQEQWKLVRAKGEGWYDCLWVKPGTGKTAPCRSFVRGIKVKDKHYLVGAAYYLQ
ncbi:MAG: cache domain-containing protein [Deltaproteobacteria bacterium]